MGQLSRYIIGISISESLITIHLLLNKVFDSLSIILQIKLHPLSSRLAFTFTLLTDHHHYLAINTPQRRILFSKVMVHYYYPTSLQIFKISVCGGGGLLRIASPHYSLICNQYSDLQKLVAPLF